MPVHFLGDQRVKRQTPDAEDQLVLQLEVRFACQRRNDATSDICAHYYCQTELVLCSRGDSVHVHERVSVLINPQHHLQAARRRLYVLIALKQRHAAAARYQYN